SQLPNVGGYPYTPGPPGAYPPEWMGHGGGYTPFPSHPVTPGWGTAFMGPQGLPAMWGSDWNQPAYRTPYQGGMPGMFPGMTPYDPPDAFPPTPGRRRSMHRRDRSFGPQREMADIRIYDRWFEGRNCASS